MVMKLTPEQQEIVLQLHDRVRGIVHKIWERSHTPRKCLEELQGEAVVRLCQAVGNYVPGKLPRDKVIFFQVTKTVITKLGEWRHWGSTLEELNDLLCPEVDEEQTECVLRLLEVLPAIKREVIESKFGLSGELPMSYAEMRDKLGIGIGTIRWHERKALEIMKGTINVAS